METKLCSKCKTTKPVTDFFKRGDCDRPREMCKTCHVKRSSQWKREHPAFRRKQSQVARILRLRKRYGMSASQYLDMFKSQGEKCAICGATDGRVLTHIKHTAYSFAVDHNHTTGKVRGLLCAACNRSIGLLKECPRIIGSMIRYLVKHNGKDFPIEKVQQAIAAGEDWGKATDWVM